LEDELVTCFLGIGKREQRDSSCQSREAWNFLECTEKGGQFCWDALSARLWGRDLDFIQEIGESQPSFFNHGNKMMRAGISKIVLVKKELKYVIQSPRDQRARSDTCLSV
jgi:hypothetical protein